MTTARIISTPADGHGLTDKLTDPHYNALSNDQPAKPLVALVILDPSKATVGKTAKGKHRSVSYEITHLEPVLDANHANDVRWNIQALYEARTSTGAQRPLPGLDATEQERQLALMERIEDWSGKQGLTASDLEVKWRANFGIEPGAEWSFGDRGVPGDYRKASHNFLLQFAYDVGVLSLDAPLPHEDRDDDEGDDSDTSDEVEDSGTGQASDSPFTCQVCNKGTTSLTDGLCDNCARNAGLPVLADEADAATGTDDVTPIDKKRKR